MATTISDLPPMQARFVEHHVAGLNLFDAAKAAGYKDPSRGWQLVRNNRVAEAIEEARKKLTIRVQVDANKVIQEVCCIAFADPKSLLDSKGNPIPIKKLPEQVRRALTVKIIHRKGCSPKIEMTLDAKVKSAALEKLLNYLGVYEHNDPKKVPLGDDGSSRNLTDEERIQAVQRFLGYDRRGADGEGVVIDSEESATLHGETGNPDGTDDGGPVASGSAPQPL